MFEFCKGGFIDDFNRSGITSIKPAPTMPESIASPSQRRKILGIGRSREPAPSPTHWIVMAGGEPKSLARVVAIAAPVGVTSSLSIPLL